MAPPALDSTMGALFIGTLAANALYAISLLQAFFYYRHYQDDTRPLKALVAAIIACNTIHQGLITHAVYFYLISNWGSAEAIGKLVWSIIVQTIFNSITGFLVKCFLTMRVWRLSCGNILLTTTILLLVFAELGLAIAYTVSKFRIDTFVKLKSLGPLSLTSNILATVGDLSIAAALCILLHQSRTGFQRSDTIINKLILFTINTGLLTSLCALASFISYMVASYSLVYVGFWICIGRLYSNTLLATLNARRRIRRKDLDYTSNNTSNKGPLLFGKAPGNGTWISNRDGTDMSIQVNTTNEHVTDHIGSQKQCDDHNDKIETSSSSVAICLDVRQ